jgi:hypothetical protein
MFQQVEHSIWGRKTLQPFFTDVETGKTKNPVNMAFLGILKMKMLYRRRTEQLAFLRDFPRKNNSRSFSNFLA